MFDVDWLGILTRDELRERTAELVAEACAWAVGLSDRSHHRHSAGRLAPSGTTIGQRAAAGLPLADDEHVALDLADARPGSFRDALAALDGAGVPHAVRFADEVLEPFAQDTGVRAGRRARREQPDAWAELAEDVGEDPDAVAAVIRAGDWVQPLRSDAELLVLAALGDVPLLAVEAEGLPLSLVRAAEAVTRGSAAEPSGSGAVAGLDGVRFLASAALAGSGLPTPVAPEDADRLLAALIAEGLAPDEVLAVLPDLPVLPGTQEAVTTRLPDGTGY